MQGQTSKLAAPLREFFELYYETERQFIEFDRVVPYHKNPDNVYSPVLYGILQSLGSQTDGLLKALCRETGVIPAKPEDFPRRVAALDAKGLLSFLKVVARRDRRTLAPFGRASPAWWGAYNKTKHELPLGLASVTLRNAMEAMSAVFCLLYIGLLCVGQETPGTKMYHRLDFPEWILDKSNWEDVEGQVKTAPHAAVSFVHKAVPIGLGSVSGATSFGPVNHFVAGSNSGLFDLASLCVPVHYRPP